MGERIQKVLSRWGVASRRQAEAMILQGRVRVNGAVAQLGQSVNLVADQIEVDRTHISSSDRPQPLYLLLNKPIGVVSTCSDPQHRKTVLDLLEPELSQGQGLHPVGRLDVESTGALLLTNDGALTFALTHPSHQIAKTYHVWLQGCPPDATLDQWRQGVLLGDRPTLPAAITVMQHKTHQTLLQIVLTEGRNRQIRRVAEQLGYPVIQLHRVAIGSIQLNTPVLVSGDYRFLTDAEIHSLKTQIGLTSERKRLNTKEHPL